MKEERRKTLNQSEQMRRFWMSGWWQKKIKTSRRLGLSSPSLSLPPLGGVSQRSVAASCRVLATFNTILKQQRRHFCKKNLEESCWEICCLTNWADDWSSWRAVDNHHGDDQGQQKWWRSCSCIISVPAGTIKVILLGCAHQFHYLVSVSVMILKRRVTAPWVIIRREGKKTPTCCCYCRNAARE